MFECKMDDLGASGVYHPPQFKTPKQLTLYLAVNEKVQRKQILLPFILANIATNLGMLLIYSLITGVGRTWSSEKTAHNK